MYHVSEFQSFRVSTILEPSASFRSWDAPTHRIRDSPLCTGRNRCGRNRFVRACRCSCGHCARTSVVRTIIGTINFADTGRKITHLHIAPARSTAAERESKPRPAWRRRLRRLRMPTGHARPGSSCGMTNTITSVAGRRRGNVVVC